MRVDRLYLIGVLFLQVEPLLVRLTLHRLHIRDILFLRVADLFLQLVNLQVELLPQLCPLGISALNTLIGGQFLCKSQLVIRFLLFDPVHRILISGRNQLILNTIDLAVDLLSFLTALAVFLLERFPSGKLLFQAELAVIFPLFRPILKGVESLLRDLDGFITHLCRSRRNRNDSIVDADGHTLANVFTKLDKLAGGRMAVQRLLCRIQRRKTQITACLRGAAQLRADAIDKALRNIPAGFIELILVVVHFCHNDQHDRLHRRPHGSTVAADRGAEADHHLHDRGIHARGMCFHGRGHRKHQLSHRHINDRLVLPNGRACGIEHIDDRRAHGSSTVIEGVGKVFDTCVCQQNQRIRKVHKCILIHILHRIGKRHQLLDLCDRAGELAHVDTLDRGGVSRKTIAEENELVAEICNAVVSGEETHKPAAVRNGIG